MKVKLMEVPERCRMCIHYGSKLTPGFVKGAYVVKEYKACRLENADDFMYRAECPNYVESSWRLWLK